MSEKPVTATEAALAYERYSTFERKLKDELVRKISKVFQEACSEVIKNIEENLRD